MLQNYLKIALRLLSRSKAHSFLNVLGLAIGLGCFILIFLFVRDELSYDTFHEKGNRIYRIAGEYDQGGDRRNRSALTTYRMKRWLDTSFPNIENVVRLDFSSGLVKLDDKRFQEQRIIYADPNFFEVFSFDLIHGQPSRALAEPNSMVITEAIARKYFGKRDPLNETLEVMDTPVKVTGIMKEMPPNSHFHGDFVISIKTAEPNYPDWVLTNATGSSHYTYVELAAGVRPEDIEQQIHDLLMGFDKHFAESRSYFLQPLQDIHLRSNLTAEIEPNGDIVYVYVLSAVAIITLLMASINYMNLAVARSAERSKEVGIRKVAGAGHKQLMLQFLGEAALTAILALVLALLLVEMGLPFFNNLTGKSIYLNLSGNALLIMGLVLLALIVGTISGSYPALILAAIPSVRILRGGLTKTGLRAIRLRKALVIVQFTASVALLVGTLVILQQLHYMQNKKLGIIPK